jgi:hypothetical protein
MEHVTANDLKVRGVAAIEEALAGRTEAAISVRGKARFVVMAIEQHERLRLWELEAALAQSRADLAAGHAMQESADAHMERLERLLAQTE